MNTLDKLKIWLISQEFECNVEYGNGFFYDSIEDTIIIGNEDPDHMCLFKEYCRKLGLKKDISNKTLAFLHELGHEETMPILPEKYFLIDYLRCILETPSLTKFGRNIKASLYYRLPVEKVATMWAVNLINNYPVLVNRLEKAFDN